MDTVAVLGHEYLPRVIDSVLNEALETAGAVVVEGPRACGKTMTAMHAASSYALLDDEATAAIAEISPVSILEGTAPRLLDEWQLNSGLWNLVRRKVDAASQPGLFILTGSAVPADDATRHTGAGRFLRIRERTMTWAEKADPSDDEGVSIRELFAGEVPPADLTAVLDYPEVVERLAQPGFPALAKLP
ncbi:MAG: AAA family ATPase, partial [Propionibacteriaceae bacterium]|nr:AAA family ATPase [Propionibacteriaceae bacterium]